MPTPSATGHATSAASSGSTDPGTTSPDSPTSRCTRCSTAGRSPRASPSCDRGGHIMTLRERGLVSQVFDEQKLRTLGGELAVGHVRYSTTGSDAWENTQPVYRSDHHQLALAHNGNLINAVELHAELREQGVALQLHLGLGDHRRAARRPPGRAHRGRRRRRRCRGSQGAFSTVVMTKDTVIAFRDPAGLRPLVLGQIGDRYCVASESCAFDIIGAELPARRPARRGRHALRARASRREQAVEGEREAFCVFEYIYFARPDSRMGGQRPAGRARPDGRDPRPRGARAGRRPRHRGARLGQRRRPRLRPRPRACRRTTG